MPRVVGLTSLPRRLTPRGAPFRRSSTSATKSNAATDVTTRTTPSTTYHRHEPATSRRTASTQPWGNSNCPWTSRGRPAAAPPATRPPAAPAAIGWARGAPAVSSADDPPAAAGGALPSLLRHWKSMSKGISRSDHRRIFDDRFWLVNSHVRAAQSVMSVNLRCCREVRNCPMP